MKDLTAESSRNASGFQQPLIPSHHGNGEYLKLNNFLFILLSFNFFKVPDGAAKSPPPARPPPPQVQQSQYAVPAAAAAASAPYPMAMQGMPAPIMGYSYMPPLPASFNPYATLPGAGMPYPAAFNFPQAPPGKKRRKKHLFL